MTKDLLWRGMLAGILAALLATLFARVVAEPQVDRAIAFEASHEAAHDDGHHHEEEGAEPVSRATQRGAGLLTAMTLYGAAIGGIFSLVFAYGYGRIARVGPRTLAAALAILAFIVVALVPALKYPPNPPAVGQPDTIQIRTAAYFAMLAASIIATVVAFRIRAILLPRLGGFDALLAGLAAFVLIVIAVQAILPPIDEVPADFPAQLLWKFRIAALGIQALLWSAIGLGFGWMAERVILRAASGRP
jgi:predicted cobalt transporter CbtA